MSEGKWIPELTAAMPLAEAARRTLHLRLGVVGKYLKLALHATEADTEYVHHLRVGIRRAMMGLRIFSFCLPQKTFKQARRQLRRLRRAAGLARDWDVFRANLAERGHAGPGADFLLGYALGQRAAAQDDLASAALEFDPGYAEFAAQIDAAVLLPATPKRYRILLDLAGPLLGALAEELRQAAERNLEDYQRLHRVRILGKRLRYAMEVFADCYSAPFREHLYPAVEEMQDVLGRANDSQVARRNLEALRDRLRASQPKEWKRTRSEIESLLRFHQRRLPQERKRFVKWWERWQAFLTGKEFMALMKKPGQGNASADA